MRPKLKVDYFSLSYSRYLIILNSGQMYFLDDSLICQSCRGIESESTYQGMYRFV